MLGPQEKKGKSIQSRLIMLLLFILIPVLAIQAYIYYDSYQARRASEFQANLEIARAFVKTFESFVQDILHHELVIGLAITSSQPMNSQDIARLLNTFQDYAAIRDFTWLNPEGVATFSSNPAMVGMNYSDRAYFRNIADGPGWTVGELVLARTTGQPVFGISHGIRDDKGALLGAVVATVLPEKLDSVLAVERGKGGGFALVDRKGMLVYRYPSISATWEERNWLKQYPEYEEALKGREITKTVYASFERKNRLVSFTPISSIGWVATAGKTEEGVTGPIFISMAENGILFLAVSFVAFLIAIALSRKIAHPVAELSTYALAVGRGEKPVQVRINHVSEFQTLAEAFNKMAEEVQAREVALRESEKRYRTIVETANEGIWKVDAELSTTFVNDKLAAILGYSPQEMIGMSIFDFMDEEGKALAKKWVECQVQGIKGSCEHKYVRKDGSHVWTSANVAPQQDSEGKFAGFISMLTDITERKLAEKALQESEQRFRRLYEAGLLGIMFWTTEGGITDANDKFLEMLGYDRQDLSSGRIDWLGMTPPEYRDRDEASLKELKATGVNREPFEKEYIRKDGSRLPILVAGAMLNAERSDGVAFVLDISKRKQAEESLRRLNESLEQTVKERTENLVAANREMEVRAKQLQQLASQLTMTEQRERKQLSRILHDGLQQYLVAAKMQLGGLIDQAIDGAVRQTIVDAENLLGESLRVSRSLASALSPPILRDGGLIDGLKWLSQWKFDKHGLKVDLVIQIADLILAEDVKMLLFESVRELLLNVVKHAGTKFVKVKLSKEDGNRLRITVSDEGRGFDPGVLKNAESNSGGFGLFSIRERIGLIGGKFEFDSSPGKGARFTLTAPLGMGESLESLDGRTQHAASAEAVSARSTKQKGGIRILLTDDHAVMREGLAGLLGQESDFEVIGQASDGQEALEKAGVLHPDVILMDISMPRMGGVDATRAIHKQYPGIHIIGLSLYAEEEQAKEMLDAGATFYITKSGPPAELKAAIRSCMSDKIMSAAIHSVSSVQKN